MLHISIRVNACICRKRNEVQLCRRQNLIFFCWNDYYSIDTLKKKGKKRKTNEQKTKTPSQISLTFCGVKTLWALLKSLLQVWVRTGSEICCLLTSFKRVSFKNLFMVGEDMPEKIFAHKTAVKWISTHWDQENVKKYVLPKTSLPTWSLLQKVNTISLQVSGNLVTEK